MLLLVLGILIAASMGGIATLGDLGRRTPAMLLLWGAAHAAYVAAACLVTRRKSAALPVVLAAGLVARLLLLGTAPTLSEDVYRYLWDGRLVAHGVNPFPHPPSDPALAGYRNDLVRHLNHADVPTIYPPAAQFLFAAAASLGETPLAWKTLLLALETLLVLTLLRLLRNRGLPPERLLLYYWNPLVLVESFGSGHVDLAAAAFLLLAVWYHEERRPARAGIAFALAALTKYVPAVLAPWLARRRAWALLGVAALTAAILFVPFLPAGAKLGTGLAIYARHWEFNGGAYRLLRALAIPDLDARRALAAAAVLATLLVAWRARSATGAALASLTAFLLLSPTLFPWYLVPAAALLPIHPDPGLIAFSGLAALSYLPLPAYRASGAWSLPGWIVAVEYGGLLLAWAIALAARPRVDQREHAHVGEPEEVEEKEG